MAQARAQQRASYPLGVYNFRVSVDGADMRFSKVSGLTREHQTVTYRDGLSFRDGEQIAKFRIDTFSAVTFEQGTVAGHRFLYEWLERPRPSAMEISLCDEQGVPVVAWRIARALPVKLTAPAFDAAASQVAIDALEIRAAGISVAHLA